jgi:hypothetical protein
VGWGEVEAVEKPCLVQLVPEESPKFTGICQGERSLQFKKMLNHMQDEASPTNVQEAPGLPISQFL